MDADVLEAFTFGMDAMELLLAAMRAAREADGLIGAGGEGVGGDDDAVMGASAKLRFAFDAAMFSV